MLCHAHNERFIIDACFSERRTTGSINDMHWHVKDQAIVIFATTINEYKNDDGIVKPWGLCFFQGFIM